MAMEVAQLVPSLLLLMLLPIRCSSAQTLGGHSADPLPSFTEVTKCCSIPETIEGEVFLSCARENGLELNADRKGISGSGHEVPLSLCLTVHCAFNATGLIGATGGIDASAWKQKAKSSAGAGEWGAIQEPLVDECLSATAEVSSSAGDAQCNYGIVAAGACFFHQSFLHCPSSEYRPSPECDAAKESVAKFFN